MKIIPQLWNGHLEPIVHSGRYNKELKQLELYMERHLEKLEKILKEEEKLIFEKYSGCVEEYITLISEQSFTDGFSIGTKITVEALNGAEALV